MKQIPLPVGNFAQVAFTPTGLTVAVAGVDAQVLIYDRALVLQRRILLGDCPYVGLSPDGRWALAHMQTQRWYCTLSDLQTGEDRPLSPGEGQIAIGVNHGAWWRAGSNQVDRIRWADLIVEQGVRTTDSSNGLAYCSESGAVWTWDECHCLDGVLDVRPVFGSAVTVGGAQFGGVILGDRLLERGNANTYDPRAAFDAGTYAVVWGGKNSPVVLALLDEAERLALPPKSDDVSLPVPQPPPPPVEPPSPPPTPEPPPIVIVPPPAPEPVPEPVPAPSPAPSPAPPPRPQPVDYWAILRSWLWGLIGVRR